MLSISRREFFRTSAVGATAVGCLSGTLQANPLGLPIGSQTYYHRQRIKNGDFAGLCRDMAAAGIGEIELCSPGYSEFAGLSDGKQTRKIIEDAGLKCPSSHFTLGEFRKKLDQSIAWAKEIGMTQIGTATLSGKVQNGATTMDVVKRAADEYNKIAETSSKAGLQQFLHDEGFEMAKVDGRLVYQVLLELLDPNLVKMQFQMSAMPAVGDPVMYFDKYPGRFISMHLQGVMLPPPAESSAGHGHGAPPVAVGKDSVDWHKVFAAARTGGVKNYFVEQPWDVTVQSVNYLKTLNA
ncbi:MAG: sugar phosphate isomerase/epimerase [Bryobacteraceae bacterium]